MDIQYLHGFHFIEINPGQKRIICLLHGTGADEYDLLPLVSTLAEHTTIVSIRGNVKEQGMNRFFARTGPGIFDQKSIRVEVDKMAHFIDKYLELHSLKSSQIDYLGYSNGANMVLAFSFLYPQYVERGVLLHAMLPFNPNKISMKGKSFLVTFGRHDTMIAPEETEIVIERLKAYGASVQTVIHEGGHGIEPIERQELLQFLAERSHT